MPAHLAPVPSFRARLILTNLLTHLYFSCHESPGCRQRRPRACARLEARVANRPSREVAVRARQRRHRRPCRHGRDRRRRYRGARGPRRTRTRSISPSSAPSSRSTAASPISSPRADQRIFGPSRAAAQLECSKVFAKALHGAPRHSDGAISRLRRRARTRTRRSASGELGFPVVVKADGLAAGKGVVVARRSRRRPNRAIRAAMEERQFGDAGSRVVLEECLTGPRCRSSRSATARAPRRSCRRRITSASSTAIEGPNTGGMGAFSPSPLVDAAMQARIMREIIDPVVRGAARRRASNTAGSCMPGLMLTCDGPEGDRVQRALRRSRSAGRHSGDRRRAGAAPRCRGRRRARRRHRSRSARIRTSASCSRAGLSRPGDRAALPIHGLDARGRHRTTCSCSTPAPRAATMTGRDRRRPRADGRRPRRPTYDAAIARAYAGVVERYTFDGMHYRRDIGRKALPTA